MARPKVDPAIEPTRDRVLLAAAEVFAERGSDRATLAEIALRAGITRPSLLYHFPTKDALYAEVVRLTFATLAGVLGAAMATEGSFEARLEAVTRTFASYLADHPALARLVCREMLESDGPGVAIVREQVAPLLEAVVAFVERAGAGHLRPGLPVRAAILQVQADLVLQSAAVGVRDAMWGPPDPGRTLADRTWALVKATFLGGEPCGS